MCDRGGNDNIIPVTSLKDPRYEVVFNGNIVVAIFINSIAKPEARSSNAHYFMRRARSFRSGVSFVSHLEILTLIIQIICIMSRAYRFWRLAASQFS